MNILLIITLQDCQNLGFSAARIGWQGNRLRWDIGQL